MRSRGRAPGPTRHCESRKNRSRSARVGVTHETKPARPAPVAWKPAKVAQAHGLPLEHQLEVNLTHLSRKSALKESSALDVPRCRKLGLSCLGLLVIACGAAPAPEPQSPRTPAPRLTELDALERDFEVSSMQLVAQLRRRELERRPQESGLPGQAPARAEPPPKPKGQDDAPKKKEENAGAAPTAEQRASDASTPGPDYAAVGSPCDLMCRALSSMQRSAAGICSLAGEANERCRKARSRLELAGQQVSEAGCACLRVP